MQASIRRKQTGKHWRPRLPVQPFFHAPSHELGYGNELHEYLEVDLPVLLLANGRPCVVLDASLRHKTAQIQDSRGPPSKANFRLTRAVQHSSMAFTVDHASANASFGASVPASFSSTVTAATSASASASVASALCNASSDLERDGDIVSLPSILVPFM